MPRSKNVPVLAAFLASLILSTTPAVADEPFVLSLVDDGEFAGQHSSIAVDGDGRIHIAYEVVISLQLRYAVRENGAWTIQTVPAAGQAGFLAELALDPSGLPHIAYYAPASNEIIVASRDSGGTWTFDTAASSVFEVTTLELDIDDMGSKHLSWGGSISGQIQYVVNFGFSWSTPELITNSSWNGVHGMAVGPLGSLHFVYNVSALSTQYRRRLAGSFDITNWGDIGEVTFVDLDVDAAGGVAALMFDDDASQLRYRHVTGDFNWDTDLIDVNGGKHCSIVLDASARAHLTWRDDNLSTSFDLNYAFEGTGFQIERVDVAGGGQAFMSIALDERENPVFSYYDGEAGHLLVADAGVHLLEPVAGDSWPVGAVRAVEWAGRGSVDVELSADGGASWQTIEENLFTNSYELRVPHLPTRFGKLRIVRNSHYDVATSDSLFTIDASVVVSQFRAAPRADATGVVVSWDTEPGPEDLLGYDLERSFDGAPFEALALVVGETEHADPDGRAGARYRLTAINGFGTEVELGIVEVGAAPPVAGGLSLRPVPYRSGELSVTFDTGAGGATQVEIYDVGGRRVARLVDALLPAGVHRVTWDGRSDSGRRAASGTYYVRNTSGGRSLTHTLSIVK